jgi:ubiquinone/menaquinone biosynthesis C-methylase UbiE
MATSGATEQDAAQVRARVHAMWAGVAPYWAQRADEVDARGAVITERMLANVDLRPGERVLELACGPGGAGLAAAVLVGPTGEVVVSDVAEEMAAIAAERAAARGLTQVRALRLDLEDVDQPDESYDVVLCRDGLMFAFDLARAAAEIRRVLRPGGRVAVAVWGPRAANPWLASAFDAVTAETGIPVPPPGVPGPFALDDIGRLRALLTGAPLADVVVEEVSAPMVAPSFDAWWTRTQQVAGPLASLLSGLPEERRDAITARVRQATAAYAQPDGTLVLPGLNLVASGCRA